MGRNWRPKKVVECDCGWKGIRADIHKACPKCGHYYPPSVKDVTWPIGR